MDEPLLGLSAIRCRPRWSVAPSIWGCGGGRGCCARPRVVDARGGQDAGADAAAALGPGSWTPGGASDFGRFRSRAAGHEIDRLGTFTRAAGCPCPTATPRTV